MGLLDFLFNNQTGKSDVSSNNLNGAPSKEDLVQQIACISRIRDSFRNTVYMDNIRKARMVNNMTTFKSALVFAYDSVLHYGVAKDVISSSEDFMSMANIGAALSQMLLSGNKVQFHSIMKDTLESWESHQQAISALSIADKTITEDKSTIEEITKTLQYLSKF